MKKRVLALLLCLILCISLLPVSAFADDCDHEIVKMAAKATCGESYRNHYKCTKCGKLFSDAEGEHEIAAADVAQAKPEHKSDLKHVEEVDPTCTEGGNAEYWKCTECGQMFSENPGVTEEGDDLRRTSPIPDDEVKDYIFPPLGHDMTYYEAEPHTCFENGNIAYYECSNCWGKFSDPDGQNWLNDVTDYAGHTKTEEYPAHDRTCTEDGNDYYFYCSVCDAYYDEDEDEIAEGSWVIPAGHDYVWHEEEDPSCTETGNYEYYTCNGCDKVFDADLNETTWEAITINKVPHTLTIHEDAVPKTCTTDGNVEYYQCEVCYGTFADAEGTSPIEDVTVPASHELVAHEAKDATCTEDGNYAYYTCENCDIILNESFNQIWLNDTVISATGHNLEKVESTATCTEAGYAEHYKCSVCGALFKDASGTESTTLEELAAEPLGHEYDWTGWCVRCGAISPEAPAFDQTSLPIDGVVVHVTAPEGVFPADAQLYVAKVPVTETKEAVDSERDEGATVVVSYTFDIKVLKNGQEIQPADGSQVNVSFALAAAANENLEATVYHVTETEEGGTKAEKLETSVEGETVTAVSDGFSLYTVELTYQELQYVLPGGTNVPLETVLNTLNLHGTVQSAISSDTSLFDVKNNEDGVLTVYSYEPFQSDETLVVKLDGVDYTIKVTDTNPEITGGNGNTATYGYDYNFTINCALTADTLSLYIDNNTSPIAASNYTIKTQTQDTSTSSTVTLKASYISTLSTGTHNVVFSVGSSASASGTFKVAGEGPTVEEDESGKQSTGEYALALNLTYSTYGSSVEVYIDRVKLDAGKYSVTEGSTIVTLENSFIGTLEAGPHSMQVSTSAGQVTRSFKTDSQGVVSEHTITMVNGLASVEGGTPAASAKAAKDLSVAITTDIPSDREFYQWESSDIEISAADKVKPSISFTMPDKNVTVKATTKYKVNFVMNGHGGTTPATQHVAPGGTATRPTDPTDANFYFDNWYDEAGKVFDFKTAITKDTTLYAKWKCTVTFYTAHGKSPATQIVEIGGKAKKPDDLSWIGYKWGGWYSGGKKFDFSTTIEKNTDIVAKWIPDLKITKGDGGTAHYGSTYPFTLNYYYPDYMKNDDLFDVYIAKKGSDYGKALSKDHYVVSRDTKTGRVIVTLKASYIRTLTDKQTYNILFETGIDLGSVEGTFKVSKSPKTGDESNIGLWIAVAGISAAAAIAIIVVLTRKRKKGKQPPTPPAEGTKKTKKKPKE